jgi:outer membrane protein OmpA-like peptidoglycan-associated protein
LTEAQRAALADGLVADRKNAKYAESEAEAADTVPMPQAPPAFSPSPEPAAAMPDAMAAPDEMSAPPPPPIRKVRVRKPAAPSAVEKALAASGLSSGGPFDHSPVTPTPRESPEPDTAAAPPDAPSLPPVPVAPPTPAAPAAAQAADNALPEAPALAAVPAKPASAAEAPSDDVPTTVTAVHFASGSTALPPDAAASLAPVAGILAKAGGKVHVVSHAASGSDASASLAAYQAALARAKAVKQGLVATGIPESSITTEVSSSITTEANDTAEVLVGK